MEVHLERGEARLKEDSIFQAAKYWLKIGQPKKKITFADALDATSPERYVNAIPGIDMEAEQAAMQAEIRQHQAESQLRRQELALDMDATVARSRIQTEEIATRMENIEVNIADALGIDRRAERFTGVGQAVTREEEEEPKLSLMKRLLRSKPIRMMHTICIAIWGILFVTPVAATYVFLFRPSDMDLNDLLHKYAPFPTRHD